MVIDPKIVIDVEKTLIPGYKNSKWKTFDIFNFMPFILS